MPVRTRVAVIGAGPAGLLLSHLLGRHGIESVVVDSRSREEIETTIRAGILEQGTVEILSETGASDRVLTAGRKHEGMELRFDGEGHRIDFAATVGRAVWLYPQHEVLKDLVAARLAAGQDLRFGVTAERVEDAETNRPRVVARDAEGGAVEIEADVVVGADGSRSVAREAVTGTYGGYFREYPFAWFGILCEAPPSAEELIYSNSPTASPSSASAAPACSACTSSATRRRIPGRTARNGCGRSCGRASPASPSTRAASSSGTCSVSAASSRTRCAGAGWCSSATRPTPCRPPAPRA
ncbi:hypothetical protein GCM10023238_09600 [Streptomyces heliomycini]